MSERKKERARMSGGGVTNDKERMSEDELMTITPGAINGKQFTCMVKSSNRLILAIFMRLGSLNTCV